MLGRSLDLLVPYRMGEGTIPCDANTGSRISAYDPKADICLTATTRRSNMPAITMFIMLNAMALTMAAS